MEKENKDLQKENYKKEIDKKEKVKLVTEKTSNRTNVASGVNKFQKRHRNKRSNSEDTRYQKKVEENGHSTPRSKGHRKKLEKIFGKLMHQAIIRQEEHWTTDQNQTKKRNLQITCIEF